MTSHFHALNSGLIKIRKVSDNWGRDILKFEQPKMQEAFAGALKKKPKRQTDSEDIAQRKKRETDQNWFGIFFIITVVVPARSSSK